MSINVNSLNGKMWENVPYDNTVLIFSIVTISPGRITQKSKDLKTQL